MYAVTALLLMMYLVRILGHLLVSYLGHREARIFRTHLEEDEARERWVQMKNKKSRK